MLLVLLILFCIGEFQKKCFFSFTGLHFWLIFWTVDCVVMDFYIFRFSAPCIERNSCLKDVCGFSVHLDVCVDRQIRTFYKWVFGLLFISLLYLYPALSQSFEIVCINVVNSFCSCSTAVMWVAVLSKQFPSTVLWNAQDHTPILTLAFLQKQF